MNKCSTRRPFSAAAVIQLNLGEPPCHPERNGQHALSGDCPKLQPSLLLASASWTPGCPSHARTTVPAPSPTPGALLRRRGSVTSKLTFCGSASVSTSGRLGRHSVLSIVKVSASKELRICLEIVHPSLTKSQTTLHLLIWMAHCHKPRHD